MGRGRQFTTLVACATACGAPRESQPQPKPLGAPGAVAAAPSQLDAAALPPGPSDASPGAPAVPALVAWDHLVAGSRYPRATLYPIRSIGVLEPRGVVAVAHGKI